MPPDPPLVGYCDRLSVRPGERVRFRVGAREGEVPYRADIVRLRCADVQPEGAAFSEEVVESEIAGAYSARLQRIDRGSRAVVPAAAPLGDLDSFSVQVVLWPTRPLGRRQALVASWLAGLGDRLRTARDDSSRV